MSVRSYLVDAFNSLGARINKRSGGEQQENAEGLIGALIPELTLDQSDEDLVALSNTWEKAWNESDVKSKWQAHGDENEKYWKGDHYDRPEVDKTRPMMDNAIFEGLETYLPQVTRRNPEPMVSLAVGEEQSKPNQDYAHALQMELAQIADDIKLRLKLKGVARHWSIRLLGAVKMSWDSEENRPSVKVVRPSKLLLDPEATVDEDNYTGERLGEHRRMSAAKLISFIKKNNGDEKAVEFIKSKSDDALATEFGFIEWWTPDFVFWKMESFVLFKKKNPHWNYDEIEAAAPVEENAEPISSTAENGMPVPTEAPAPEAAPVAAPELPQGAPALPQLPEQPAAPVAPQGPRKGVNHFKKRRMPYLLLSIYNLGKQPVDITSLMGQNLSNQDLINKRNKQIDKNADTANNGMVVSLERSGLTKDQATRVTAALRNGGVVAIPAGAPQEAIYKPPMNELPVYVYNQLVDTRNRVRDIWGTRGSSPAGLESDTTVRGKILSKGADTDRIGGGISEFLEQLSDDIYNWIIQLLYVYDQRFIDQIANGTPLPQVKASVKEGSLLPKDSTTIANQAIELSTSGKMSSLDLFKRLDYPNPEELAANAWLEVNAPEILYANDPRVAQVVKQRQDAAAAAAQASQTPPKEPSMSINYKDVSPDAGAQMLAKVGIQSHPEGIAAHAALKSTDPLAQVPLPDGTGPTPQA
jgi:hypothetical protein